jgi:putative hemolysin
MLEKSKFPPQSFPQSLPQNLEDAFDPEVVRDSAFSPNTKLEIWVGDMCVRLAESEEEVKAAQRLRYKIFYEEMRAQPTAEILRLERDFDHLDALCDHLLVIDSTQTGNDAVVGTYRLITRKMAIKAGGFYSASEYDVSCLEAYQGEVLEVGRSCVAPNYRTGTTMQMLWRGLANYAFIHDIELMFGCASFHGTDVSKLHRALAYLHHYHLAPEEIRPRALPSRYVEMNNIPFEKIDVKEALAEMPPLIKGYLRIGGLVSAGAVIDWQFNTTDVCMIVRMEMLTDKYKKNYSRSLPNTADGNSPAA